MEDRNETNEQEQNKFKFKKYSLGHSTWRDFQSYAVTENPIFSIETGIEMESPNQTLLPINRAVTINRNSTEHPKVNLIKKGCLN